MTTKPAAANDTGKLPGAVPADARLIADAALFAARAHSGQLRKDSGEPYANHLAEVAALVAAMAPGDFALLAAAWLHDVAEETAFTLGDIETLFGAEIAGLVGDVTDPAGLKGKLRRERQVTHTMNCGPRIKQLKLADKASNIEELIGLPAHRFDLVGSERYLKWARRVVAVCRGVAPEIEARFDRSAVLLDQQIAAAKAALQPAKPKKATARKPAKSPNRKKQAKAKSRKGKS